MIDWLTCLSYIKHIDTLDKVIMTVQIDWHAAGEQCEVTSLNICGLYRLLVEKIK